MIIMTVLNIIIKFFPNPTIPRGTASDGRIEDATSEEPNINAVPPPTTGKFTETNQIKSMLNNWNKIGFAEKASGHDIRISRK